MLDSVQYRLVHPTRITSAGVAVSGGADSVFLLYALRELGVAAAILHVNHGLRGADSKADEAFVRQLAESLHIPFFSAQAPVTAGNTEQEARRARLTFFQERKSTLHLDAIATGHTLDDQAETVLLRFLRGSGTQGLAGILPRTKEGLIRPLLDLRRADIRRSLLERGIAWREDGSNESPAFDRNRIRLEILPALEQFNPSLALTLSGTAQWALDEEAWWTAELSRLAPQFLRPEGECVFIQTRPLHALQPAPARRLIRHAIHMVRGNLRSIDFHHVEAIRSLAANTEGSGRLQLPGLEAYRSFDLLRLSPAGLDARLPRDFSAPLTSPGRTTLPDRALTIDMELVSPGRVYNDGRDALEFSRCRGPFRVRNWRPGDSYRRRGAAGAVKIKELFQEFRVPLWERRTWPVIVAGSTDPSSPDLIVWSRRFGVAEEFAASTDSKEILLIRESGESVRASETSIGLGIASGAVDLFSGGPDAEVL